MSVYEAFEYGQPQVAGESYEAFESYETGEVNEAMEMELAQQLLEVNSEAELEEFLGRLFSRVAQGAKTFMNSGVGQAVGGVLRNVAKTALPMVGSAVGSLVAPGVGTAIGGRLGSMASSLLEVSELESMAEGEAEFEAARRYVRWAAGTVRNGMRAPRGSEPRAAARAAAVSSARRYAPALLSPREATPTWRNRRRGRARFDPEPFATRWSDQPERTCRCGHVYAPASRDGWVPAGSDDDNWEPAVDSNEAPSHPSRSGRWFRDGERLVIVGA